MRWYRVRALREERVVLAAGPAQAISLADALAADLRWRLARQYQRGASVRPAGEGK